MQKQKEETEANKGYRPFDQSRESRAPTSGGTASQQYNFSEPQRLQRDYEGLYKALEEQTRNQLGNLQQFQSSSSNQVQLYKDEAVKFQSFFEQVFEDNKKLFLRCKELEQFLTENSSNFQGQHASLITENELLRKQNQELIYKATGQSGNQETQRVGIRSTNRIEILQSELEDLKRENYDLKLRLQAQIQDKGLPYSRVSMPPPERVHTPVYYSPVKQLLRAPETYCDSVIQSNEQHNRAVLDRCKSIVAAHSYY